MTRKDYVLIAKVLSNYTAEGGVTIERDEIARLLADAFSAENPRFDRTRFLKASMMSDANREAILAQLA